MLFNISACNPFQSEIIDLGEKDGSDVTTVFSSIDWVDLLRQMEEYSGTIYYSPSFQIEHLESNKGLEVSIVGHPSEYEWYIFFNTGETILDTTGLTTLDVLCCLDAFVRLDWSFIQERIE